MKRIYSALITVLMMFFALTSLAEDLSVGDWLNSKGECSNCAVTVAVQEIINPVLASVYDETGAVNLYGVTVDGEFTDFIALDLNPNDILVLNNPVYNEYEGTVEMADSVLVEHIPAVTLQSWLDAKGEFENCTVTVTVQEIANPVLASVSDETASVNLYGVTIDGEFTDFIALDLQVGDTLVLSNPVYNEYEGTIEMADSMLIMHMRAE